MSENIKVCYADLYNAGDLLNKDLIEKISGKKVIRSKSYDADMMAIGGALIGLQYSNGGRKIMQKALSLIFGNKPIYIWGAGFWHSANLNSFYRKNIKVCALRGAKTKEKLSELMNKDYDVPLADAGLLIDMFLEEKIEKKYSIGVIPHMFQQNDIPFLKAKENSKYHFIDIKNTPQEVIRDIAKCEMIISSSLHGLIFADSLHIPSLRLEGTTPLLGGTFKFEDYYSCYGLDDNPWILSDNLPSENDVIDRCKIDYSLVDMKKKQLIECFPRF